MLSMSRRPVLVVGFLFLQVANGSDWHGCESFPGFGSASDDVTLSVTSGSNGGQFNITTGDFLSFFGKCKGSPDLVWSHRGSYECDADGGSGVTFTRSAVTIRPLTTSGVAFGKVLCPNLPLTAGESSEVPLDQIGSLCASLTFNNCAVFRDAFGGNTSVLRRSSAPSCKMDAAPVPDGPPMACTSSTCEWPCPGAGNGREAISGKPAVLV